MSAKNGFPNMGRVGKFWVSEEEVFFSPPWIFKGLSNALHRVGGFLEHFEARCTASRDSARLFGGIGLRMS